MGVVGPMIQLSQSLLVRCSSPDMGLRRCYGTRGAHGAAGRPKRRLGRFPPRTPGGNPSGRMRCGVASTALGSARLGDRPPATNRPAQDRWPPANNGVSTSEQRQEQRGNNAEQRRNGRPRRATSARSGGGRAPGRRGIDPQLPIVPGRCRRPWLDAGVFMPPIITRMRMFVKYLFGLSLKKMDLVPARYARRAAGRLSPPQRPRPYLQPASLSRFADTST